MLCTHTHTYTHRDIVMLMTRKAYVPYFPSSKKAQIVQILSENSITGLSHTHTYTHTPV